MRNKYEFIERTEIVVRQKRQDVERDYNWQKWRGELPFLAFDADWEVKIVPPLQQALVRFLVRSKTQPQQTVSVMLNGVGQILDLDEEPYWDIQVSTVPPTTIQLNFSDTDNLINAIRILLNTED